jgi:hypothetical protein
MDAFLDAARRTGDPDPERLARIAYNKRVFGAVYPPALEAEVLKATRTLS